MIVYPAGCSYESLAFDRTSVRQLAIEGQGASFCSLFRAAKACRFRAAIDGEDIDAGEIARNAFGYSNMTGWIPTFTDPLMSFAGLDDLRINPYGPYHDLTPPVVKMLNDIYRIPGAADKALTGGDLAWHDEQALRAIPFAGTYGLSRLFD